MLTVNSRKPTPWGTFATVAAMVLFAALLVAWVSLTAWIFVLIYVFDGWRGFFGALDPRRPTESWFWFCTMIFTPGSIIAGLVLAYLGRWRTALLVIPAFITIAATGGVIVYVIDQLFI